jgi:hypothetical protein
MKVWRKYWQLLLNAPRAVCWTTKLVPVSKKRGVSPFFMPVTNDVI